MTIDRRIAISGAASTIQGGLSAKSSVAMEGFPPLTGLHSGHAMDFRVGPGTVLTGGILARLGLASKVEAEIGTDSRGERIVEQARQLAPRMFLLERRVPGASTFQYPGEDWLGEAVEPTTVAVDSPIGLRDLPLGEMPSRAIGIWCYPHLLVATSEERERAFAAMVEKHAARGVTQVLQLGRPLAPRQSGGTWQEWLRELLPNVDVICAQAGYLLELLDPRSAARLESEGKLSDFPTWLTGRTLHELSGYLLSCGLGVVAIGLGEHGVYLRTNADSAQVAFTRKFAPDDQMAAHMAMWTERDMLTPLFEARPASAYSATDALTVGCVASILNGKSPGDALRLCAAVVSFCVEADNPLEDVPTLDVVEARVDGGWEQAHCRLDLSGWVDDEDE